MTDNCPVCGNLLVTRCRCPNGDRVCPEGHWWHRCSRCNSRTVIGPFDHGNPANPVNLCPECREDV